MKWYLKYNPNIKCKDFHNDIQTAIKEDIDDEDHYDAYNGIKSYNTVRGSNKLRLTQHQLGYIISIYEKDLEFIKLLRNIVE